MKLIIMALLVALLAASALSATLRISQMPGANDNDRLEEGLRRLMDAGSDTTLDLESRNIGLTRPVEVSGSERNAAVRKTITNGRISPGGSTPWAEQSQTLTCTLSAATGADALQAGVIAGLIGFTFVALYMLVYYQGLGLVTWVGLSVYATLVWGVVATIGRAYGWTLTLPGIAGLIISIGIAADSKIIIFERLKEEMRNKKTFRTAVDSGFWHGFRTSLDADLVTLFAAIVLFLVGIGEVRGFALTLIIGLSLDIFTMLFFTRPVLGLLAQVWPVKSPALLVRTGGVTKSA